MKRKYNLDILKVIGLFCIILAHVNPPEILFQLRNFDVVLMILISSYLGLGSVRLGNAKEYLIKRFVRLILPCWTFLTIFFIISVIFNLCDLNLLKVISSYALESGIGYVWIIRIYFIISILVYIFKAFDNQKGKTHFLIFIIYIIYEILCHYNFFNDRIIYYFLAFIIPCYLLVLISKYIFEDRNKRMLIGVISLLLFVVIGIYLYALTGNFQPTQVMKYPFRLYYLAYGVFVSSVLISITNSKRVCTYLINKFTIFFSSHSLWIYLWHILILFILDKYNMYWLLKYLITVIVSTLITFVQSKIVEKTENDKNQKIIKLFKG